MNPSSLVTTTQAVDTAFYVIFGISALALLGVTVAMVYFVWRYNRKRQPQPISQKDQNLWLEVTWTIIPTLLVMVMFWYGWEGYLSLRRIPDNAMPVSASARMWSWLFTYDNGKTSDKLYVPVGQPVRIKLTSEDVLHSFYVPAFRVKRDCVPGMVNYVWFVAEHPGSYDLFCAEYCGVGHSAMITTVEALPAEKFKVWLTTAATAANSGRDLLQKHGCLGCHSLDGSKSVGPSFQGIAGRQVVVMTDGKQRSFMPNRNYLETSILKPGVDIVVGFPPVMPSFAGKIPAEELVGILDYLLTLNDSAGTSPETEVESQKSGLQGEAEEETSHTSESANQAAPSQYGQTGQKSSPAVLVAKGETLARQNGCLGCHSLDGSRRVGPSLQAISGREQTVTRDGQDVKISVDAAYLERSLRDPNADIVKGYPPVMPSFSHLSEADIKALVAWLESLK